MSGLPASGKSTLGRALAKALGLPMLDKDDLLEALFDSQGVGDAGERRRLSRAADRELIRRATEAPAAVVASWWRHPRSTVDSGTPTGWLLSIAGEVVELHCACSPDVAVSRFMQRTRHAGHLDSRHDVEALLGSFRAQALLGPLGVGRVVEVDTEEVPDVGLLVNRLGIAPSENRHP